MQDFFKVLNLNSIGDSRGDLISLEGTRNIPFEIKRVYYIYNVPEGISRGFHAHKSLKQILICMGGSCRVRVDNGTEKAEIILDSPNKALLLESGVWREMSNFSEGSVLVVLASQIYQESDYIRDYDEFLKFHRLKS